MENSKLERVLSLLLGVSWSILTFGTVFTFILLIISSSISTSIISTFIIFLLSATLVIFLESLKLQIKQSGEIKEIIEFIKSEKDIKTLDLIKILDEK